MLTLDFGADLYPKLLEALPPIPRERVRSALTRQPYRIMLPADQILRVMVAGQPGDKVYTNPNESYPPFIAEEFIAQSQDI